jgi:hypothetical protein
MDAVRKLLKELMAEGEWTEARLSERVGKNRAFFNQYFKRGTPKILPEPVRDELAIVFRVAPETFKTGPRGSSGSAGALRAVDGDVKPILGVDRIEPKLLPDGSIGIAFQNADDAGVAIPVTREMIRRLRQCLDYVEKVLDRASSSRAS